LLGLIDIEALESVATTKSSRGQSGEFAGSSRPHRGGLAAGSRAEENPPNLKPDAACAASAVSTAKAAAPRPLNGAHQSPVVVPAAAASSL
jgi:hypothetical protein